MMNDQCHANEQASINKSTFLSENVRNLLCCYGVGEWKDLESPSTQPLLQDVVLIDDGYLDIHKCFKLLESLQTEGTELVKDASYYRKAAFVLSPVFKSCENFLFTVTSDEYIQRILPRLEWTGNKQIFLDCFHLLKQKRASRDLLALLLVSTGIEQTFRNIFAQDSIPCPNLLKDILTSDILETHIGSDAVQVFHLVMGPPISMNLRNVAWHGFLSENEIPESYAYFLLTMIVSLKPSVPQSAIPNSPKPLLTTKVDSIAACFPNPNDELLAEIKCRVLNSWICSKGNICLIEDIFHFHQEKQFAFSCILGFPILENVLRQQFVEANHCPHRILIAESTCFFTTFEVILDYSFEGEPNCFVNKITEPFMDLLHDLLMYPDGPRARDRLSHGEIDVNSIPASLSWMLIVCLYFVSNLGGNRIEYQPLNDNQNRHDVELDQQILSCVQRYESIFHPVTELKQQILNLCLKSGQIFESLQFAPDLQPLNGDEPLDIWRDGNIVYQKLLNDVELIITLINNSKLTCFYLTDVNKDSMSVPFGGIYQAINQAFVNRISTLYRWQKKTKCLTTGIGESEIIGLMRRMVDEILTIIEQSKACMCERQASLEARTLRSRQRDNTKRLIQWLPNLVLVTNCLTVTWTWVLHLLNKSDDDLSVHYKNIQKVMKSMLQVVENIRTFTNRENNKWTKSEELLSSFLPLCHKLIQHLTS